MRGGSAGCRRSTTTTSTPRQARSNASVSPTGPAPTISTSVSMRWFILSSNSGRHAEIVSDDGRQDSLLRSVETRMQCDTGRVGTLLSLEVHLANDAAIFFVLFANERTKIRATHFYRIESDCGEFFPYIGDLHRGSEPACDISDCFLRRIRGREQSEPTFHLIVVVAGFSKRHQIRKQVDPRSRCDGEGAQVARLELLGHIRVVAEIRGNMVAQQRVNRRSSTSIWHEGHFDVGDALEDLEPNVRKRCGANARQS